MTKIRRCDDRCHNATGTRCKCWCGGFYHGATGIGRLNRAELDRATQFLAEHGGKPGEAYLEQRRLPL